MRTDKRVARTYNNLFTALLMLLSEKSFDNITVTDLCEKADIHRATFYKHFTGKHDFLVACFRVKMEYILPNIAYSEFTPENLKTAYKLMLEKVLAFIRENESLFLAISRNEYSSSFSYALGEAISDCLKRRLNKSPELSEKLGLRVGLVSAYCGGATVGLIDWLINNFNSNACDELLRFTDKKIEELCDYFESIMKE